MNSSQFDQGSPIAVLGIAEHFNEVTNFQQPFTALDIRNLQAIFLAPFYPFPVRNLKIILMAYGPVLPLNGNLIFKEDSETGLFVRFAFSINRELKEIPAGFLQQKPSALSALSPWHLLAMSFPKEFDIITRPTRLCIEFQAGCQRYQAGELEFLAYQPPPLSSEIIAALKSHPSAIKAAHYEIGCKKCNSHIRAFLSLDRESIPPTSGSVWFADLPAEFRCRCGATQIDLRYLRAGFHGILGDRFFSRDGTIVTSRLYEPSDLVAVLTAFKELLDQKGNEDRIQNFLQDNPIGLHFLAPQKIMPKARILGAYQTDFAVLTTSSDLILIELEGDTRTIVKKNSHPHSHFTHALSQVNDWLDQFRHHRAACLEQMGLHDHDVARVRGMVIIGRSSTRNAKAVLKLKASHSDDVSVMTYDDLLLDLANLVKSVKQASKRKHSYAE